MFRLRETFGRILPAGESELIPPHQSPDGDSFPAGGKPLYPLQKSSSTRRGRGRGSAHQKPSPTRRGGEGAVRRMRGKIKRFSDGESTCMFPQGTHHAAKPHITAQPHHLPRSGIHHCSEAAQYPVYALMMVPSIALTIRSGFIMSKRRCVMPYSTYSGA